jgi:HTH-type transcriptional regulator, sugar sensing transcriptional regulator
LGCRLAKNGEDVLSLYLQKSGGIIRTSGGKSNAERFIRENAGLTRQIEIVEHSLVKYGLSDSETKTYLYLAMSGEKRASEIAEGISLHRTEAYRILRDLEKRGIVIETLEAPLKFSAVPLDKAVEQLVQTQRMKVDLLEKEKSELIQIWSLMPKPKIETDRKEVLQVLDGTPQIILKAKELVGNAKTEVKIFVPDAYLAMLYNCDFFESLEQRSFDVSVSLLTENSLKSRLICEQIGLTDQNQCSGEVEKLPCFMVVDKTMLITIYRKKEEETSKHRKKTKVGGLWTNCGALVSSMLMLFSRISGKNGHEGCLD